MIRNGLVIYIHINLTNKNITQTDKMVARFDSGNRINVNALKRSIRHFLTAIATLKKNLTRNWDAIIQLLDKQFALPMQPSIDTTNISTVVNLAPAQACIAMKTSHYHGMQHQLMDAISIKYILVYPQFHQLPMCYN